jgi:outer membrane protein OmpA-like peptidoglycan-associated protein
MKTTGICVMLTLAFAGPSIGQEDDKNLISNYGFESATTKSLKKEGKIELAEGWFSPTPATADLYSKDAGAPDICGAPGNFRGNEQPYEGSNYAGFVAYSYNDKVPRTYVMTKLMYPLKKGSKYCVSFKVSLSDLSKYASNNVGAHLSKKALEAEEKVTIINDIHVKHSKNKVINQQFNWQTICSVYEAKGDEEWIAIGNFASNRDTKYEQMKKPEAFKSGKQTADAYYFVDDVQVFYLDSIQECMCEKENVVIETDLVYSKQIVSDKELKFEEKLAYGTVYFKKNSSELIESAQNELALLAEAMKSRGSEVYIIHGHSDKGEVKDAEVDPKLKYLSQRRANAVKKFLTEKGISESRLEVSPHDDAEAADSGETDLGKAKNRRVEFTISK